MPQNLKLASAGHEAEDAVANVRCRGYTVKLSARSQGQVRGERPFAGAAGKSFANAPAGASLNNVPPWGCATPSPVTCAPP